jgi:ubiquinone/menaquinone biosynthesis C-methylase UbiE
MTDTVPELFDRLADRYDQVIPFFAEFAGQLLDVLDPDPGTRLLDIGSGRGAIAAAAAARGCAVTAVDAAPRMVSLLDAAHPEIDVRLMDVHRLDLPDDSYDLVTGGFVIHLVTDRARVLAELRRVLRPGARIKAAGTRGTACASSSSPVPLSGRTGMTPKSCRTCMPPGSRTSAM